MKGLGLIEVGEGSGGAWDTTGGFLPGPRTAGVGSRGQVQVGRKVGQGRPWVERTRRILPPLPTPLRPVPRPQVGDPTKGDREDAVRKDSSGYDRFQYVWSSYSVVKQKDHDTKSSSSPSESGCRGVGRGLVPVPDP